MTNGFLALLVALGAATQILAQDGSVDATFQSPLFDAPIPLITLETNGNILYLAPNGINSTIVRLTSTGAPGAAVNTGFGPEAISPAIDLGTIHIPGSTNPASIDVLLPMPNGQILVGGTFTHFNRVARKLLVRLNADGSVDTSFNKDTGFTGANISSLALGPGGKIYAGGKFTKFGAANFNTGMIRLNGDGSIDNTFTDSSISFGASVQSFTLQPDGKVLIDAAYANASFQPTLQVYRLGPNGGLDTGFMQGAGTPVVPAGIRHGLLSSGQILVAGGSGLYNGSTVNSSLFWLNADGKVDTSFPGVTLDLSNISGSIGRFLAAANGNVYFSGPFDKVSGQPLHGLGRLFPDGTLDASFVPAVFVTPAPMALALQPDGKILVLIQA